MSVVGFDVGNENCVVGVARQRGIDVVLNDESKRETPGMVSFTEKQRFLGTAAVASLTMNPSNTITQIKRLLGRRFSDPELQHELKLLPCTVTEGPDDTPLIHVQYMGESRFFSPTQILGMILANLKTIAERNLGIHVVDCVIGIPIFFTELQRRAYMDAASIAGLRPLRLIHEPTATALAYGIYKTDFPEGDPINVAFVDVGHSSMHVCVVAFKKRELKVLGHAFDRSLGGRDFDEVLFNYFSQKFKEEYKIDVPSNKRASQRLRAACEKLKKVLSANPQAPLSIECLMDEKDVRGFMKREDFEKLAAPLLERVAVPCERALAEANLTRDSIHSVELVGSGSRIPSILRILSNFFKKEPGRTMNASECITRGCTLQCAMLSPTFKVREFEVQDAFPFSIALSWKVMNSEAEAGGIAAETVHTSVVFPKGCSFPVAKMLTFYRSSTFTIDVHYADTKDLPPGTSQKISTFTIGPIPPTKAEKSKLKVRIRLNLNGIISVESATLIEEEAVDMQVSNPTACARTEIDKNGANVGPPDGNTNDVDGSETKDPAVATENGAPIPGEKPSKMEVEAPKEDAKKRKSKRTDVPINETVVGGLPQAELQKAIEREYEMALQDRVMEETKERKNAVEAYVYDMRDKLYEKYQDYATDTEKEQLSMKLQEMEDWLYDDGEDETKGVYIAKLAELKKLGDPIEERYKEEETRAVAINELQYCINSFRESARSNLPNFDHIDASEKEKVILECIKADDWLKEKKQQQDVLPKCANPVLLSADIKRKAEMLDRFCKPIMMKARPVPPKPAAAPEPAASKPMEEGSNTNASSSAGEPCSSEPMEADNTAVQDGESMQMD